MPCIAVCLANPYKPSVWFTGAVYQQNPAMMVQGTVVQGQVIGTGSPFSGNVGRWEFSCLFGLQNFLFANHKRKGCRSKWAPKDLTLRDSRPSSYKNGSMSSVEVEGWMFHKPLWNHNSILNKPFSIVQITLPLWLCAQICCKWFSWWFLICNFGWSLWSCCWCTSKCLKSIPGCGFRFYAFHSF